MSSWEKCRYRLSDLTLTQIVVVVVVLFFEGVSGNVKTNSLFMSVNSLWV